MIAHAVNNPASLRHIILLTDGNNEWFDYPGIKWDPSGSPRG